jgi:hypothetical protein
MSSIGSRIPRRSKAFLVAASVLALATLGTAFAAEGAGSGGAIPTFEVTSTAGSALTCQVGSHCPFRLVGHGVRTQFSTGGIAATAGGVVKVAGANGSISPGDAADFAYAGDYICTSAGTGSIRALWQAGPGNEPGVLADGITITCTS